MWLNFKNINTLSDVVSLKEKYHETWQKKILQFIESFLNHNQFISIQTSGSTGSPKKMFFKKENMLLSAQITGDYFNFKKGETALSSLSTDYIVGKMMIVRSIHWKLNLLCQQQTLNPLQQLNKTIDFMPMVPLQLNETLQKNADKLNLIKNILIGGTPLSQSLLTKIQDIPTAIYESFGMTETLTHFAIRRLNGKYPESEFSILPKVEISTDHRNCLIVKAPFLPEKIITNDIVKIIDNNRFKWLGRYDNLINSGGIKLIPEVLEQKIVNLLSVPYFFTAFPDEKLGKRLVLVIESTPNTLFKEKLNNQLHVYLSKYEIPKEIIFQPKFERTQTGKIKRQ